jgi:hypothetical protein
MILLNQPRFEKDTIVRFELSLKSGEKLIRAEARVVGYHNATSDKPGGPKVRFKRFGGTTKAFIQRVMAEHGPGPGLDSVQPGGDSGAPASEGPMSLRFSDPAIPGSGSGTGVRFGSDSLGQGTDVVQLQSGRLSVRTPTFAEAAPHALGFTLSDGSRQRLQQLMERDGSKQVPAPQDREALLSRLRQRADCLAKTRDNSSDPPSSATAFAAGASSTG